MGSWRRELLTPLQVRALEVLRSEPHGYFLTGGAVLGPYYLHHRMSADLDLFTPEADSFRESAAWADRLSGALGARLQTERAGPSFRRISLIPLDAGWPRLVVPLDLADLERYRQGLVRELARAAYPAE